jgi:hypothetical protein
MALGVERFGLERTATGKDKLIWHLPIITPLGKRHESSGAAEQGNSLKARRYLSQLSIERDAIAPRHQRTFQTLRGPLGHGHSRVLVYHRQRSKPLPVRQSVAYEIPVPSLVGTNRRAVSRYCRHAPPGSISTMAGLACPARPGGGLLAPHCSS